MRRDPPDARTVPFDAVVDASRSGGGVGGVRDLARVSGRPAALEARLEATPQDKVVWVHRLVVVQDVEHDFTVTARLRQG